MDPDSLLRSTAAQLLQPSIVGPLQLPFVAPHRSSTVGSHHLLAVAPLQLSTGELAAVVVFGVLSLGGGAALCIDAIRRIRFRRRATTVFERVDAIVVDAAVHEPVTGGAEAVPHVEYEYTVDGETHASRSIWPTRSRSPERVDRSVARRIVEDHPVGAEVIARYDPEDTSTAFLVEHADTTGERIELAVGMVLLGGFAAVVAVVAGLV